MKKSAFIIILFYSTFIFAQKGTIIPDVKQQSNTQNSADVDGLKTWIMEDYLLDCLDSISKCYLIKENGINKTVLLEDVYDFVFEPGFKYTLLVKEELKAPPVNAFTGIYNYTVLKIISRRQISADNSTEPITKNQNSSGNASTIPVTENPKVYVGATDNTPDLFDEVQSLKKQVKDLKQQLEIVKMQLDLQFQLFQKKP
ncbi:MAG TPA: hypothetical protein PLS10_09930 [Chitinophagales bacterium]|nr:hypothetical protein [Chitinophagales bacterium]